MKLIPFVGREAVACSHALPQSAVVEPAAAPLPWADLGDVRRSAADAAMAGMDVADVHRPYAELFEQARSLREDHFAQEVALHVSDEQRFAADIERHEVLRQALRGRRDSLSVQIEEQVHTEASQRAAAEGLLRVMRSRQLDIETECARQRDAWERERRDADLRHRQALAEARAATAIDSREANSARLEAAADDRRTQLEQLDRRLEDSRNRCHALQQRGFTPLAAWCLIASAVAVYAGAGALTVAGVFTSKASAPLATWLGMPLFAATVGLASGVYVQGLLARERNLARQRARTLDELERLTWRPTSEAYFDPVPHLADAGPVSGAPSALPKDGGEHAAAGTMPTGDLYGVPQEMVEALNAAAAAHAVAAAIRSGAQRERSDVDVRLAALAIDLATAREGYGRATRARIDTVARRSEVMLQLAAGYRRATLELDKAYTMTAFAKKAR